jgi:hypothetical protein
MSEPRPALVGPGTLGARRRRQAGSDLTSLMATPKLWELPRDEAGRLLPVRVRSLRTQQRAESQCQKTPFTGAAPHLWWRDRDGIPLVMIDETS